MTISRSISLSLDLPVPLSHLTEISYLRNTYEPSCHSITSITIQLTFRAMCYVIVQAKKNQIEIEVGKSLETVNARHRDGTLGIRIP
jgi:hypothetical protein